MKRLLVVTKLDPILLLSPLLLVIFSMVTIYTITFNTSGYKLVMDHAIMVGLGLTAMLLLTFLDYRFFRSSAFILYVIGILLLLMVEGFGKTAFGAVRWIDFGYFQLQPSELVKLFLVILLARFLETRVAILRPRHIVISIILVAIPFMFVMRQPDLGTATVFIAIFVAMLIAAKISWRYVAGAIILVLAAAPSLWNLLQDYQKTRIFTFINPASDPYGAGYNVLQSVIAVGSGGLTGQGFGQGSQSQLNYLPVAHADFIFAGFAEATGFVGALVLIICFALLLWRIFHLGAQAEDRFASLLAVGFGSIFLWQIFINIGMNIGLAPVTGIPLPFMSYGGSAIISNFIALGILQNIYLKTRYKRFDH